MAATLSGSVSFDKTEYAVGEKITATVTRSGSQVVPTQDTFTGVLTDASGETAQVTETFTVDKVQQVATTVTVTDSGGRAWAQVSDDGSVATFTATA